MFTDEIQALLAANSGVTTLATGGIYDTVLPRGYVLPAIVYQTVTTKTDYTMQGMTTPDEMTIQFDIYADSTAKAGSICAAIKSALGNFTGVLNGGSVVQGSFWAMDMDMPTETGINKVSSGFRHMIHIRFVYVAASS